MKTSGKRLSHEPPAVTAKLGWRYHHIGIPHAQPRAQEHHVAHLGVHVAGFENSPYGIEWIRFEPHCDVPEIVRRVPHIAFAVDDLDEALIGREILIAPTTPSAGVRVAFILDDGAPVELLQFCTALPGLSPAEMGRLSGCLARLIPHLRLDCIAITGGIGMQLGLAGLGRQGPRGPRNEIADLDLVAASIDAITPGVVEQFLVSHRHVVGPGVPKFMIQLVDPVSRIRVDVFPDLVGSLADARTIAIGEHSVQLLPLERILEHKVLTMSRASQSAPIDPKHADDARVLGDVLGRPVPSVAPEALVPDVYGIEADSSCDRCTLSSHPSWPLAPKDRIFELIGYV